MKELIKHIVLLLIGGLIYGVLEIVFRGHTHWTMVLIGGLCFLLCGSMNEFFSWDTPFVVQVARCAVIITLIEFISGIVLNVYLGLNIWDYSNIPSNILGQICVPFTVLWMVLSAVAIVLDDYLRYWLFGEEKPRYVLWRNSCMEKDKNLLELLEIYIDLVEKQEEVINDLSSIVKKQACELNHLKNLYGFMDQKEEQRATM